MGARSAWWCKTARCRLLHLGLLKICKKSHPPTRHQFDNVVTNAMASAITIASGSDQAKAPERDQNRFQNKEKGTWKNPELWVRLVRIDVSFCSTECLQQAQQLWAPVCWLAGSRRLAKTARTMTVHPLQRAISRFSGSLAPSNRLRS